MKALKSPAEAVEAVGALPDYDFARRFVTIPDGDGGSLQVHLVDDGDPEGRPVVLLHGNPSWSYLWRHQIRALTARGYRVIAPDLVGMGLSDKPSELADYTVARHVGWMRALLVDALDLKDMTLVLHDWGGIIGLRLLAEVPDRVRAASISNTGLPSRDPAMPMPDGPIEARGPLAEFQLFARDAPTWEPWTLLGACMATQPSDELVAAYRAPYPDQELTIGSRAFTQLLPTRPDNPMLPGNWEAWKVLYRWEKPFLTVFSELDVVAPDGWREPVERIPGAQGQPHAILPGGGHFLQEDVPDAFTDVLVAWLEQS